MQLAKQRNCSVADPATVAISGTPPPRTATYTDIPDDRPADPRVIMSEAPGLGVEGEGGLTAWNWNAV